MSKKVAVILDEFPRRRLVWRCPGCGCSHGVPVALMNASQGEIWSWNGSLERPTLSPSILVEYGREPRPDRPQRCHSYVTDGRIQYLADCEHALAGKIVDIPPF